MHMKKAYFGNKPADSQLVFYSVFISLFFSRLDVLNRWAILEARLLLIILTFYRQPLELGILSRRPFSISNQRINSN